MLRLRVLALPLALLGAIGCGSTLHQQAVASPQGRPILSEDGYTAARGDYEALAITAPARAGQRAALESYLADHLTTALEHDQSDDAYALFKQMLTLYTAAELRAPIHDPVLLDAAKRIDAAFRKRGAHEQVLTALVVEERLGVDAAATRARYAEVTGWLQSLGSVSEDGPPTDGRQRVVDDLEAVVKVWPSPFAVEHLSALYWAQPPGSGNTLLGRRPRTRAELRELLAERARGILGYELARLYLRVSEPQAALAALHKLSGKPGADPELEKLLERLGSKTARPTDALAVAMYFAREGSDDRDVSMQVCEDATVRFPKAPEPRVCTGQLALSVDRLSLALKSFEAAVALDPTRREPVEALARLYQMKLFQIASVEDLDVSALEGELRKVEAFHVAADKRFSGKPIHPTMGGALFEVGRGYYNAGRVSDAVRYLDRSIATEASPSALELLGQIRMKTGDPRKALALFERAVDLPKPDKGELLYWRAKLRREMADCFEEIGDGNGASSTRKAAIADWELLAGFGLTPEGTAEAGIERGKLLYQLGERDAALTAFEQAIDAAPDRGSSYADIIAFLIPRGELNAALEAYHRALARNEVTDYLKVYCSLWIVDLEHRAGKPADPLATAYLQSTDGAKWYDDLARWATGRESDAALTARANTAGRKAESAYYRSMRAYGEGKRDEAKALWKQVIASDMMAFFEYDMAALHLRMGRAPSAPLLASKPPSARERSIGPRPPAGSI